MFLIGLFMFSNVSFAYGQVMDYFIFNVPYVNVFSGRSEAGGIISNAQFVDTQNHWANEAIAHGASLGLLHFSGSNFMPNTPVTLQEGLGIIINLMGLGEEVLQAGLDIVNELVGDGVFWDGTLEDTLYLGFLDLARDNDIISDIMFNALVGIPLWDEDELEDILNALEGLEDDADGAFEDLLALLADVVEDLLLIDPLLALDLPERWDPITRQQMVAFIAMALEDSDQIQLPNQPRDILAFNDWQWISPSYAQGVEAMARVGAISGTDDGFFDPWYTISRAEVAQILRNIDHIHYDLQDIERNVGTVASYRNHQEVATLQGEARRNFYIRRHDGDVDVITHQTLLAPTGQIINYNAPVFRNGQVGGLDTLQVNDQIEYLTLGDTVLYINVIDTLQNFGTVTARLMQVDIEEGTILVTDDYSNDFTFHLTSGIFGININDPDLRSYLIIDNHTVFFENLPFGSLLELTLINNLVTNISFVGQPELVLEMRGVIIDNNPAFGYLTFIDNNGNIVTRFYNQNNMQVQRQAHYQSSGPGYIAQMFPHFAFNPLVAHISDLQPGDIVFMRFDPSDPTLITSISAATHHVVRHGLVRQVSSNSGIVSLLLQFDNGQTTWFDLGPNIFVTRQGRPINNTEIQVGDRLRLLVNQAILGPGHVVESVLEASLEGEGHHISTILTGHLAGINGMQNSLMLQNSRPLTGIGWGAHTQIQDLNLSRQNIQFFHENQQISLDHAQRFLSRSDLNTYVAMDSSPFGETIRQITFRNGRDELLNQDTVISTTPTGGFMIASVPGIISTDDGTIVRRNGRMVSGNDILTGDIVRVSLNGGNNAAVVDILDTPAVSGVGIARVRILNVNEGVSFTVQSMATLQNHEWMFTPVERVFTINPNTLFLNEDGWVNPSAFIGFTADTVVDSTFTVVYNGAMATHVIDAPFGNRVVRGNISATDDTIQIRDAQYLYNPTLSPTYVWNNISNVNPTMNITTHPNTIIVRNNQIVQPRDLQLGDRIRVLTHNLPANINPGISLPGYIILVD